MKQELRRGAAAIGVAVIATGLVCCDRSERDAARWLDLEIVRPEIGMVEPVEVEEPVPDAEGMLLKKIPVPDSIFFTHAGLGDTPDPFADPVYTRRVRADLQKVFVNAGITFSPGAYVRADPASSALIVRQTPEQMELLLAYMEPLGRSHYPDIVTRIEIYELSETLAMRLIRSASPHRDHTPEKEAVIGLLREAKARLLLSTTLHTRSGQRARVEDGYEFSYPLPAKPEGPKSEIFSSRFLGGELTRTVGTWLEIDPVVSPDIASCDIGLKLEFHVTDPTWQEAPGASKAEGETRFPRLQVKTLHFNEILKFGETRLVGSWNPAEGPNGTDPPSLQLVFLQSFLLSSESMPPP